MTLSNYQTNYITKNTYQTNNYLIMFSKTPSLFIIVNMHFFGIFQKIVTCSFLSYKRGKLRRQRGKKVPCFILFLKAFYKIIATQFTQCKNKFYGYIFDRDNTAYDLDLLIFCQKSAELQYLFKLPFVKSFFNSIYFFIDNTFYF